MISTLNQKAMNVTMGACEVAMQKKITQCTNQLTDVRHFMLHVASSR